MAVSRGNFNRPEQLTSARVVSTSNVSGTYFNGPTNNGVGATLTTSSSTLTVDSVVLNPGDSVLLTGQTAALQNGIYFVSSPLGANVVLTRREDFQSAAQLHAGMFIPIEAGTIHAGSIWAVVEPIPVTIGVDAITIPASLVAGNGTAGTKAASDNAQPTVASVNGATTADALAVFADTAGTVKDATTTTTLGQHLNVTGGVTAVTSNLVATAGNVVAGSSGNAGTVGSFPAGATSGELLLAAVTNASGNFNTTISNASAVLQSQVISIPDSGATTANFILSKSSAGTQSIAGDLLLNSNPVVVNKTVTATFTDLATAGKVNIFVAPTVTAQIAIIDLKVFKSTGLSGGGGNRLLSLADGTLVFNDTGITAALLGAPIFTLWGGTGNPIASATEATVSTAGANVFLQYISGTTDYTAGSVIISVTYAQVTA